MANTEAEPKQQGIPDIQKFDLNRFPDDSSKFKVIDFKHMDMIYTLTHQQTDQSIMYSGQTTRSINQEDKKIYRTDGTWEKFKGNEE